MSESSNFVKECIKKYRSRLLDTSKRNNLISFHHNERSRDHIRIIDELPDFLYNEFLNGKKFKFLALPEKEQIPADEKKPQFIRHLEQAKLTDTDYLQALEAVDEDATDALDQIYQIEQKLRKKVRTNLKMPLWEEFKNLSNSEIARKYDLNPSYEMPQPTAEDQQDAEHHTDKNIQTLLKPQEMNRKLSGLTSYIRTDTEETGVNTLYVAFGFLEWHESASSEKKCLSPLLLLQLEIEKKQTSKGYSYYVEATGEELEINLPLAELLRNVFGIKLPQLSEEETPEKYMQKVNALIQEAPVPQKEKWKIRRFISIGRFRFARLVMFHDLNPEKWSDATGSLKNEIINHLFAGSETESTVEHAQDYNIDTPEVEEVVPLLITDADASQHSALVDVMKGQSMAIKGPPGTGKSQTITNMIANALATGKSVLFLAEKMAALNVVYGRLSKAKLEPYCLELHSTKARKTEVLKSLQARLELEPNKQDTAYLTSKLEDFKRHRDHITEYINVLNSHFGCQNRAVYDYLWAAQLRKDKIGALLPIISQYKIPFEQADLSSHSLNSHTEELEIIAALKKEIDKVSIEKQHPWGFLGAADLDPFQQDELKSLIGKWRASLQGVQAVSQLCCEEFSLSLNDNIEDIKNFCNALDDLITCDTTTLKGDFLARLKDKETAVAVVAFVQDIDVYKSSLKQIQVTKNIDSAIKNIEKIESYVSIAKNAAVENMTRLEIRDFTQELEEEVKLWDSNLVQLTNLGKKLGMSDNEDFDRFCSLIEVLELIASTPHDYLALRKKEIMGEANTSLFKASVEKQERVQAQLQGFETNYDLALLGQVQEIRRHAAALDKKGFSTLFDSSYREAKKVMTLASKRKIKFDAEKSVQTLRTIADNLDEKEKIEKDSQLQGICGSFFAGINTDFRKLEQVNEWALAIRKRYTSANEFSRNVRQWLLKAELEELELAKEWTDDDRFLALKERIKEVKENIALDTPLQEYLEALREKTKNLKTLREELQNLAVHETITFSHLASDLEHLRQLKESGSAIQENSVAKEFFADAYKGLDTELEEIKESANFINDCLAIKELAKGLHTFLNKDFFQTWNRFKEQRQALIATIEQATELTTAFENFPSIRFISSTDKSYWLNRSLEHFIAELSEALRKGDTLHQWVEFNRHCTESFATVREPLLELYQQKNLDFQTLPLAFEYMVYSSLAREIYRRNPILLTTNGLSLEQARARMKELNQEILELQQEELCNKLNAAQPLAGSGRGSRSTWTEGPLIHNEISKKKRHISIRALMQRAGTSIQLLKPCFLMSPLTVAQYLDSQKFHFDLVIIDEASQMRPEDALGSIIRTKQLIVVGDPQQLPPTSFFQKAEQAGDETEEDFTSEAIMDMALSSFRPSRILSRHYRSQHESLIAFSNYHFYDKNLTLFPSPVNNPQELGLRLEYVGGTYKSSSNIDEVEAIAKAALEFMKKYPDRSLGIATMNQVQKELIELEMDRAFIENSYAASYRQKWQEKLESFFVKNLENVQGDERDAIFISTVYGANEEGVVMQRFGPVNGIGGHRRLNVLFSRAKKNMVVFTSLKPEDIKVNETASEGLRALKGFLTYAAKGVVDEDSHKNDAVADSDFEVWIKEKLESIGCEVHPQVGVAGYRIDLGVKHPQYSYGYLLGIECDGARYHSSKSARERDIIRQQVLEGLGWRIYRIWSTDWFSNPLQEFEKLKKFVQDLLHVNAVDEQGEREIMHIEDEITNEEF